MRIENLYDLFVSSSGVSTDTRRILSGSLFFALRGGNFNGNAFALDALEKGASYAVIDEAQYAKDPRCILVGNVLETLQYLAHYHRRNFDIPFIAVTGSNGKTTTKELIYHILSRKFKTIATKGNLNNHIGIPLTLLSIPVDTEMAIIEMGANHQKEIEGYCRIAEPTHGIITNIGKAHLEGFGGFEGVKKGKGELYDYLLETGGRAFINSQNAILMSMQRFADPVLYPAEKDFYTCRLLSTEPFIKFRAENGEVYDTHLIGAYNFDNIATALCIGKFFGVASSEANQAVAAYIPDNNRSQVINKKTNSIILDAYNANPTSMRAAIGTFNHLNASNKWAILGDMFELGEESEKEHRELGCLLNEQHFAEILLCGNQMKFAAEECASARYFPTRKELEDFLEKAKPEQANFLIKGSRSMGLEKVLDVF